MAESGSLLAGCVACRGVTGCLPLVGAMDSSLAGT